MSDEATNLSENDNGDGNNENEDNENNEGQANQPDFAAELEDLRRRNDELTRNTSTLAEQINSQNNLIASLSSESASQRESIDPEEAKNKFYTDPYNTVRDIIKSELEDSIKPLNEFVSSYRNESKLDQTINKVKSDPTFGRFIDPSVEAGIKELYRINSNQEVNEANIKAAAIQIVGMKSVGLYGGTGDNLPSNPNPSNPNPSNDNRRDTTPPHVDSTPVNPKRDKKPKIRQLTELEKRIARERGMTPEDYIAWNDVSGSAVANSTIGKEKKD